MWIIIVIHNLKSVGKCWLTINWIARMVTETIKLKFFLFKILGNITKNIQKIKIISSITCWHLNIISYIKKMIGQYQVKHFIFNSLFMVPPQIIRCVLQGAMLKRYPTIYKINKANNYN